jgi:hypothetical protein
VTAQTPEKSARGRQQAKQSKDETGNRYIIFFFFCVAFDSLPSSRFHIIGAQTVDGTFVTLHPSQVEVNAHPKCPILSATTARPTPTPSSTLTLTVLHLPKVTLSRCPPALGTSHTDSRLQPYSSHRKGHRIQPHTPTAIVFPTPTTAPVPIPGSFKDASIVRPSVQLGSFPFSRASLPDPSSTQRRPRYETITPSAMIPLTLTRMQ